MQLRKVLGLLLQQVCLQNVRKEVVVAKPSTTVIQRHQEQIPSLQSRQMRFATFLVRHRIAQWAAQTVQDRGLQQEVMDTFRLTLQDLLGQVVDDVPVIACEALDEAGHVVPALHRQRRQL